MEFLPELLTVAVVHFLGVISPGPDFVMVTRNSFVYSRRTGVYSALGLSLGMMVHMAYSLLGIGLVIAQSVLLFSIIKYVGAAYLVFIGWQSLRSKKQVRAVGVGGQKKDIGAWAAIRMGFLTNILNPKATLYFLSLFSQIISPETPLFMHFVYAAVVFVIGFSWFAGLSLVLSHNRVQRKFAAVHYYVEKVMGVALVALGLKVAAAANE